MSTPNIRPYTLGQSKFNADLHYELNARVAGLECGLIKFGTKVMYSSGRGSFDIGYYIGASKDGKTAVCLLGGRYGYFPSAVSRVDPMHLFVTDWEDRHVSHRGTFAVANISQALEEIKQQRDNI